MDVGTEAEVVTVVVNRVAAMSEGVRNQLMGVLVSCLIKEGLYTEFVRAQTGQWDPFSAAFIEGLHGRPCGETLQNAAKIQADIARQLKMLGDLLEYFQTRET